MRFIYTNGSDQDFNILCHLLDDNLNEIVGGEKQRTQYIQYNVLSDIHDVVLAYDENIPIGCASFKYFEDDTAELKRVFIKKEYRGKGISKQLINLIEEQAKEKGFKKLVLETGNLLVEAKSLYNSIGYKVIHNYGPYKDMPESICMEKIL